MIVGITGLFCSGKHTFAQLLSERFHCEVISLSAIVEDDVRGTERTPTRKQLQQRANANRDKFGSVHYVKQAMNRWQCGETGTPLVMVGIYAPDEAKEILENGGQLVMMSCESGEGRESEGSQIRFGRLMARALREGRESDMVTFDAFRAADEVEGAGGSDARQFISKLTEMASIVVDNSGSLADLALSADQFGSEVGLQPRGPASPAVFIRTVEPPSFDRYEDLLRLEERHMIVDQLRSSLCRLGMSGEARALKPLVDGGHAVQHLTNQFAERLVECVAIKDCDSAYERFRELESHTLDEEMALLTNRREFELLHRGIHDSLRTKQRELHESVAANREAVRMSDNQQFGNIAPNLSKSLERGLTVRLREEARAIVGEAITASAGGRTPVSEILKNQRVVFMNDFSDASKISHVVHDAIDHVGLFNQVSDSGLYQKFASFFDSIGDPLQTGIFKREAEIIASIGFGVRYWSEMSVGFVSNISLDRILAAFDGFFDEGTLEECHYDAFRTVRRLAGNPATREAQSLAFVLSNYLTELNEQRRKYGEIKLRNRGGSVTVLNPWTPDFLSLFVETHSLLLDSKRKHRDHLFKVHLLLEDFLSSGRILDNEPLTIHIERILDLDLPHLGLPGARIEWISRHYGFTAFPDGLD